MSLTLEKFAQAQKKYDFIPWLALKHHKTHKNESLEFHTHKYQKKIIFDKSPYLVIIKSTQNGITEYLLLRALAHAIKGMNIFYVLPTYDLASQFVKNRLDKTIQYTKYYRVLERAIKNHKAKRSESISLKDIGNGSIAFVGSNSPVGFTAFPADEIIIDELDRCNDTNIKMAVDRLSHSDYRWQIKVSNPTFVGKGIDIEYKESDKHEWHIKCQGGHWINLNWFKHIVEEIENNQYVIRDTEWTWNSERDIYPICDICGKPIDRMGPGEWNQLGEGKYRGYKITKLFSGKVPIVETLDRFQKGIVDPEMMQVFYNADLGESYTAKGSKIDIEMIMDCVQDYTYSKEDGMIIAGIDVGTYYHFVIKKMLPDQKIKTLYIGSVRDTSECIRILKEYNVKVGVIDANPETREARKISEKFKLMFLCYFGNVKNNNLNVESKTITVQRTPAIDAVKEAVLTKTIIYPKNILNEKEFLAHMQASVRVFNPEKMNAGQKGAYEWVEGNNPDHYLLATAYCLIARKLVVLFNR